MYRLDCIRLGIVKSAVTLKKTRLFGIKKIKGLPLHLCRTREAYMNTNSNQELQFQLMPESEHKTGDLRGVSTLKKMLAIGGIALISMLIPLGTESINGKTTVAATLHDDYLANGPWVANTAKLLPIDLSEENNRAEFLAVPYLSGEDKETILTGVEQGIKNVGVIYVRDNLGQGGDIIQIESGGLTMDIPLSLESALVFLPFASGESLIFRGLHDGGDGIAATIETPSGTMSLPVLAVGETIELPVR